LKYERWLIVGFLIALMAFTTSVLLIPGEKYPRPENPEFWPYNTLTTSDSGYFYGLAREIETNDGMVEYYPLSHAPGGIVVGPTDQGQPLLLVMLYRGVHAIDPSVTLMDVTRYWGPLLFALVLIPIFLIGRELAGNWGGCAAAFFAATLGSTIYWSKVGAFDRETIVMLFGAWVMFLVIRMFKARSWKGTLKFGILAGLVWGLFGLTWGVGSFYLVPAVLGGLILVVFLDFLRRFLQERRSIKSKIFASIRVNLPLICGIIGMFGVLTLVLWMVGWAPLFWVGFARMILSYVGIGAAEGIPVRRYATEMAAPADWKDDVFNRFYMDEVLTNLFIVLALVAMTYLCWTRKRQGLLVFPWLLVLAVMVWPGQGQSRFIRQWWPLVPVLAGVGVAALISIFRRFSSEHMLSEWSRHFHRPTVIALCVSLVATPFILNAYEIAEYRTTPPTEWHAIGLDEGLMHAFAWLSDNTSKNSVVAIEWSFGHLLTGTAGRGSVCDGIEDLRNLGEWENVTPIQPPDYICRVTVDEEGRKTRVFLEDFVPWEARPHGRRSDIQYMFTLDNDELADLLSLYWKEYGVKIDYLIWHVAVDQGPVWAAITPQVEDFIVETRSVTELELGVFRFDFDGENIVADFNTDEVYRQEGATKQYLAGYIFSMEVKDENGNVFHVRTDKEGRRLPADLRHLWDATVRETLVVYSEIVTVDGREVFTIKGGARYQLPVKPTVGTLIGQGNFDDIPYLEDRYTSANGLVKILEVIHENLP
jgi:hypothetical protein